MNGSLLSLDGHTALVSGGAGDIGAVTATLLQQAGARVISLDLPGRSPPDGVEAIGCDLTDPKSIDTLPEQLDKDIDLFVHCAGITHDKVLWKLERKDWQRVLDVNLTSAFEMLRILVLPMRAKGRGSIVLVSSINGERGKFGQCNYAASKAGLLGFGRSAACELGAFGIRVNMVSPGWIETSMTESVPEEFRRGALEQSALGRLGAPEDVARAILFLCSELSSYVTGQVLRVNGGQLMA